MLINQSILIQHIDIISQANRKISLQKCRIWLETNRISYLKIVMFVLLPKISGNQTNFSSYKNQMPAIHSEAMTSKLEAVKRKIRCQCRQIVIRRMLLVTLLAIVSILIMMLKCLWIKFKLVNWVNKKLKDLNLRKGVYLLSNKLPVDPLRHNRSIELILLLIHCRVKNFRVRTQFNQMKNS